MHPAPSPLRPDAILVGVVVPLFKQSVLIVDAIASLLRQQTRFGYVVVIVNDGCPYAESMTQVEALRALHPDKIHCLVTTNGGLSAARNTGIDYLLRNFPDLQALYFLDADNKLGPRGLASAFALLSTSESIGWVYPNIDMFGFQRHYDYSAPYGKLLHALYNVCEAGSLVHRRVFEAGVRFDETMRKGFEDWDFWLTALDCGFSGAHHPYFDFQYRNRGASMLTGSKQEASSILDAMRRKHPNLMSPRSLIHREAQERPRAAVVFVDTQQVLVGVHDNDLSRSIAFSDFARDLWLSLVTPTTAFVPPFIIFTTRRTFQTLASAGLTAWVAYGAECALRDNNFVSYSVDTTTERRISFASRPSCERSDLLAISRRLLAEVIKDPDTRWIERQLRGADRLRMAHIELSVPGWRQVRERWSDVSNVVLFLIIGHLRASPYFESSNRTWVWRDTSIPRPFDLYVDIRNAFEGAIPLSPPRTQRRNIGFVLKIAAFGGVERVAFNLARQAVDAGAAAHLIVVSSNSALIPEEFNDVFTTIVFVDAEGLGKWSDDDDYLGTAAPASATSGKGADSLVAALAWLDVVINCHCGDLNAAAAKLRRLGVMTASYVHLLDRTELGRSVGHPVLALAYEHAYDLLFCISRQMTRWMHAAGAPRDKLVYVPNAPGYPLAAADRDAALAARAAREGGELRALYIGRLDAQKGLDRLQAVIERCDELRLPVDWRIVGGAVIDGSPPTALFKRPVEPPTIDSAALTEVYAWADAIVVLSDYEGMPLTVLEAQRLGVIPIATDVGALSEIVRHGENGFLVALDTAVSETMEWLELLAFSVPLRAQLSKAALATPDWSETAKLALSRLGLAPPIIPDIAATP